MKVLGKTLRVDHVADYKPPKDNDKYDDETKRLHTEGCAPVSQIPVQFIKRETSTSHSRFNKDIKQDLPPPPSNSQFPTTSMSSFRPLESTLKREFKDEPSDKEAKVIDDKYFVLIFHNFTKNEIFKHCIIGFFGVFLLFYLLFIYCHIFSLIRFYQLLLNFLQVFFIRKEI